MSRAVVKYESAVICEYVRYEWDGKLVLIGVFTGDIGIQSVPQKLSLFVYADGQVLEGGVHSSTIKVVDTTGGVLYTNPVPSAPINFIIARFAQVFNIEFVVQRQDTISIIVNDGQHDHILMTREVKIMSLPPSPPWGILAPTGKV